MKLVVAHAFPVPTQPTEAWFLVEHWAESLGYKVVERKLDSCRIARGTHWTRTMSANGQETVRSVPVWGRIDIRDGQGLASLAAEAMDLGLGPIGSRRDEWEEYFTAELQLLGRDVGDLERGRLLGMAERAGPAWSWGKAKVQLEGMGQRLVSALRRGLYGLRR